MPPRLSRQRAEKRPHPRPSEQDRRAARQERLQPHSPQLDPQVFWQVHRGTVVQARCVRTARREESGQVTLTLAARPEKLVASRLYAYLFKGL